jgi:plasmid stabilization system protein ParE
MQYILTPEAYEDLADALAYMSERSARAGENLALEMRRNLLMLAEFPEAGYVRTDLSIPELRFWLVAPYFLVYRKQEDCLEVLAILHTARNVVEVLAGRMTEDAQ